MFGIIALDFSHGSSILNKYEGGGAFLFFMVTITVQEEIKQKLIKRKEQIEKVLSSFASQGEVGGIDFDADFPKVGDEEEENALEVSMYSDRLSLERELEKVLRDIVGALKQMEDGTYGICKYCHKEIPEARLLARPTSTSCVSCKEALRKGA